jgi:hypothetical protein
MKFPMEEVSHLQFHILTIAITFSGCIHKKGKKNLDKKFSNHKFQELQTNFKMYRLIDK